MSSFLAKAQAAGDQFDWRHLLHRLATPVFWLVAAALLHGMCATDLSAETAQRPNIVLMMADDQGWGDTGYMGHPILKTPHLDAMAADGLRFDRFYAAAPVCSPTRGSVLTGRHPFRYGIRSANVGHLPQQEHNLAELLKVRGYRTGHFGKWHLGTLTKTLRESNRGGPKNAKHFSPPWVHGFDATFSTEAKVPTWDPLIRPADNNSRKFWEPVQRESNIKDYGTHYWTHGKLVKDNLRGDDSRVIMDRAIPFIEQAAKANKPFFSVIWFHAPHLPVVAGPKYSAMYKKEEDFHRHYYGCITALDEQVGRLRAKLKELGIERNTLICYCADNGPEGNAKSPGTTGRNDQGLRGRKRSLFEGGIRVPGIMVWPRQIRAGTRTSVPACTSDYLPTLLAVAEVELPDSRPIDGINLLPIIDGKEKERGRAIGFQSGNQAAWIEDRYKLVRATETKSSGKTKKKGAGKRKSTFMLFDIVADPQERKDLADEQPGRVARMRQALRKWQASCLKSLAGADY